MTREMVRDPPQYYIMRLSGNGAGPQLRQLSTYPHPYPTLRDLQKEVIRCGLLSAWLVRAGILLLTLLSFEAKGSHQPVAWHAALSPPALGPDYPVRQSPKAVNKGL